MIRYLDHSVTAAANSVADTHLSFVFKADKIATCFLKSFFFEDIEKDILRICSGGGRKEMDLAVSRQILCPAGSRSALSVLFKLRLLKTKRAEEKEQAKRGKKLKAKRGIASSFLHSEQIANIETEEHLEEIANAFGNRKTV
ncbi:hypothetical protein TNCV_4077021 [Trichonephila clavipes]|nr:hypothetical protein TNCV_4077021 [Trichonephila clavipes]